MPFKFPSAYKNFSLVKVTINTSLEELKILQYLIMNLFSLQFVQNLLQRSNSLSSQHPMLHEMVHSSEGQEILLCQAHYLSEIITPLSICERAFIHFCTTGA